MAGLSGRFGQDLFAMGFFILFFDSGGKGRKEAEYGS